jgi:pimeloyl-ACP methyl ester carboxylesterase
MAMHQSGHTEPQGPAKVRFAADFPELLDSEWGFPIGGFGGIERGAPLSHVPVIFVHGNNVDHADWYPVRDDFKAAGWTDQELWALSYNGLGGNNGSSPQRSNPERDAEHTEMGWDGVSRVTANDVNVPDLAAFVEAVLDYTGAEKVSLVSHSLGVTIVRKTMFVRPELAARVEAFVGIAGGNHGTSLCAPGSEGNVHGCDEIAAGTAWLEELNGPDGSLESYGDTRWLTIYDGTGAGDVAYVGPDYAQSPALKGADNREFPNMDHNGLRMAPEVVTVYREFLEQAEVAPPDEPDAPAAPNEPAAAPGTTIDDDGADGTEPGTALPSTGGGLALAGLSVAAAVLLRRRVC